MSALNELRLITRGQQSIADSFGAFHGCSHAIARSSLAIPCRIGTIARRALAILHTPGSLLGRVGVVLGRCGRRRAPRPFDRVRMQLDRDPRRGLRARGLSAAGPEPAPRADGSRSRVLLSTCHGRPDRRHLLTLGRLRSGPGLKPSGRSPTPPGPRQSSSGRHRTRSGRCRPPSGRCRPESARLRGPDRCSDPCGAKACRCSDCRPAQACGLLRRARCSYAAEPARYAAGASHFETE